MAWRIQDSVIRGEIDNLQRGLVRGKLWLAGLAEPLLLKLKGNAAPDLAGCRLTFENPGPTIPMRADARLNPVQQGTIGDLTASRKARVFDIPLEEAYARLKKNLPVPEHLANCLYLEWFSDTNGRVVVESADYRLTISAPAWRLTPQEEDQRRDEAAEGFNGFMHKLGEAVQTHHHHPPDDKEWDEFDYEQLMREADARTDKYSELLDKYIDHPDRDRIIAREMGWTWLEEAADGGPETASGEEPPGTLESLFADSPPTDTADESVELDPLADASNLEPDPCTEGVDWVRQPDGHLSHPLALRGLEASLSFWKQCEELGLGKLEDDELGALLSGYQIIAAKLAGALNGLAYGRELREGAFVVAYLKRALSQIHATQTALEKVAQKNVLPAEDIRSRRAELFALREETLRLMQEFRRKES